MAAPTQVAVFDVAHHTGDAPASGRHSARVLDVGTETGGVYTLAGVDVPAGALVIPLGPAAALVAAPAPTLMVEAIGEEPVITTDVSGDVSVTIADGPYAGTYTQRVIDGATLTVAMIEAAPTPIVLPVISGSEIEGDTLSTTPGLWIYGGADPGDQTWAWYNSASGSLGNAELVYTPQRDDVGDTLRVEETFGAVSISSVSTGVIATSALTPDAFTQADWTVAPRPDASEISLTILSLPAANGAEVTDIEYDVDASDVWISLGITTGTAFLPMAASATSYAIRLRAMNLAGTGPVGSSQSAVSGARPAWVPEDDTGIVNHWDASNTPALVASANTLTSVRDLVGAGDLPVTGAPQTGTRAQNGLNVIDLGGTSTLFDNSFTYPGGTGDMAIHFAMVIDTITARGRLATIRQDGGGVVYLDSDNSTQFDGSVVSIANGGVTGVPLADGPFSGLVIVSMVFNGATGVDVYINDGTTINATNDSIHYAAMDQVSGHICFGGSDIAHLRTPSAFCEAIITENLGNVAEYHTYLNDKWRP